MASIHRLIKYVQIRDQAGAVIQIAITVKAKDGMGNEAPRTYSLQQAEVAAVIQNENNLTEIIENVIAATLVDLEEEVAVRPQPPIEADETRRTQIGSKLNDNRIEVKKNQRFTILVTAGPGGGIEPPTANNIKFGKSIKFRIKPDRDFQVLDVLVDGVSVGVVQEFEFEHVRANHSISAMFAAGRKPSAERK